MTNSTPEIEKHLRVYNDRSEYHSSDKQVEEFPEGAISVEAKKRLKGIKTSFDSGFLEKIIKELIAKEDTPDLSKITTSTVSIIEKLVNAVTSEVGRGLIGLSVMQLCIKSISPEQSIRLHKGSANRGSFSWVEGVSMRTLDKNFVTPTLRKYNLLLLNADGCFMTRSLAENYPYTSLYKANLKGARKEWLELTEELEQGTSVPIEVLKLLLSGLINASLNFEFQATELINAATKTASKQSTKSKVLSLLQRHSDESDYAARLLEIAMHSLMQTAVETGEFGGMEVKPLSQMRSANKKHGNIGDIELLEDGQIVESWDAKYGKGYLREEIEEAVDKIKHHDGVKLVGFVTTAEIERISELTSRIKEIKQLYSVELKIERLDEW